MKKIAVVIMLSASLFTSAFMLQDTQKELVYDGSLPLSVGQYQAAYDGSLPPSISAIV